MIGTFKDSQKGLTPTLKNFSVSSRSERGLTLLEVIIAVFILTIGIGGAFALITQVTKTSSLPNSRLVASYLAQEGVEIVRNIRDSNFLGISNGSGGNWDDFIVIPLCGTTEYEAIYSSTSLDCFGDSFLQIDGDNRYIYASGVPTLFKRKITITPDIVDPKKITVDVEVFWEEKGLPASVTAATEMYDWLLP